MTVNVVPLVDEGLGNSAYLVDHSKELQVAYAADTHLHADFLTGAVQLARTDGTQVIGSAAGNRQYPHLAVADEDEVDLGGLRLRALSTPGRTHEHVALALLDGPTAVGVLTGGSLSERTSTIGTERATNPLLRTKDEGAFVRALLDSLGTFPPYFLRLGEINRQGPSLVGEDDRLAALPVAQVQQLLTEGALVVDVRPVAAFAAAHVPGAVNIELGSLNVPALDLRAGPTVVMCGHGERAMGGASLLARSGASDVTVLAGGPQDWAQATGGSVEGEE